MEPASRQHRQGSDRATFIAFSGESPIGAALYRDKEIIDIGEVFQVWVSPEYRSKGVAVDIMDAVFRWAGENGFPAIRATIPNGNDRALRFYRKYGFNVLDGASLEGPDPALIREVEG